jgi:hypothetical protein
LIGMPQPTATVYDRPALPVILSRIAGILLADRFPGCALAALVDGPTRRLGRTRFVAAIDTLAREGAVHAVKGKIRIDRMIRKVKNEGVIP